MTALRRGDSSPQKHGALRHGWIAAAAFLVASIPYEAKADLPAGRVDVAMYGRIGAAWALAAGPQIIQGKSMNLTGSSLGGRLEEGDWLEPRVVIHILKPDTEDDTYVDFALLPVMFAKSGSFIGAWTNGAPTGTLGIELAEAYVKAGNIFTKGLDIWAGAKYYRGDDVHIADYYYFNDLSSQGVGATYKGFDAAVLLATQAQARNPLYNIDTDNDMMPDYDRLRTIFVLQYKRKIGYRDSTIEGLAEFHLMPEARASGRAPVKAPTDFGGVLGAKLSLDFGDGNFNQLSVRWGTGIANGAFGGGKTYDTYGQPNPASKTYEGAEGIELVEHFLVNFGKLFSFNGYGALNWDQGASGEAKDKSLDFAVGGRTFLYAHKNFHMINELTFQGRHNGDSATGTAVKFSIVPTIVPSGKLEAWARPHFRLIYTTAFYNQAAVDQKMSPYTKYVGPARVAQYLGTRVEWWF